MDRANSIALNSDTEGSKCKWFYLGHAGEAIEDPVQNTVCSSSTENNDVLFVIHDTAKTILMYD